MRRAREPVHKGHPAFLNRSCECRMCVTYFALACPVMPAAPWRFAMRNLVGDQTDYQHMQNLQACKRSWAETARWPDIRNMLALTTYDEVTQ